MAWLSGYTTRRKLTIDCSKIDSDLTDFPVLVKLTSSNFDFSKANSDGYDIRFTSSDGTTLLKYERERHDSTNQVAEYWVKIPSVSSSANTEFYIYYRTEDTADGADPTNVWDSHYVAVYHLGESSGSCLDSTANANHGTFQGDLPTLVDGKIAKAQDFDGSGDYIDLPDSGSWGVSGTIECWFKLQTTSKGSIIVNVGDTDINPAAWILYNVNEGGIRYSYRDGGGNYIFDYVESFSDTTDFHYAALSFTTDSFRAFLDENMVNEDTSGTTLDLVHTLDKIGHRRVGTDDGLTMYGKVDEVRFSDIQRSNAWIKASYHSGNDALLTYGSEETSAQSYSETLTETLGLSDTKQGKTSFKKSVSHSVSLTDSLKKKTGFKVNLDDGAIGW